MSDNGTWRINQSGHELIVSFPDQSPSFVNGFEAGKLWERMRSGAEAEIEAVTHTENREVIDRMALAEGWEVERKSSEVNGWDYITLTKGKKPDRLNPHGLRVVPPDQSQDKP